jgi:hypothetical protein
MTMAYKSVVQGSYRQVYGALPLAAVAELDRHAQARHMSRAQMISVALMAYLKDYRKELMRLESDLKAWEEPANAM